MHGDINIHVQYKSFLISLRRGYMRWCSRRISIMILNASSIYRILACMTGLCLSTDAHQKFPSLWWNIPPQLAQSFSTLRTLVVVAELSGWMASLTSPLYSFCNLLPNNNQISRVLVDFTHTTTCVVLPLVQLKYILQCAAVYTIDKT